MFEIGSVYEIESQGAIYRCTGMIRSYSDGMRLYEMQNIDDDSYIIIDDYGELYGEGSFDDWGF